MHFDILFFLLHLWASRVAQMVKNQGLIPGLGRFPWRKEQLPILVFWPREFHGLYMVTWT